MTQIIDKGIEWKWSFYNNKYTLQVHLIIVIIKDNKEIYFVIKI